MLFARIMFVVAYVFGQFSVVAFMLAGGRIRDTGPRVALSVMGCALIGLVVFR